MDGDALPLTAQLQAWRAQGADRADPARFDILQALAARISAHEGEARRLLEARLSGLIRAYEKTLAQRPSAAPAAERAAVPTSGLRELVAALQARADHVPATDASPAAPVQLTEARDTWARIRIDSQLRASLHNVPEDAGPLNSGMLVHRALHLMRAVSPGYLQHFIAYADTLSSLEQLQQAVAPLTAAPEAPRTTRRTPRKRKAVAT
ncbi:DUF2894 domain-containing protein [Pseudoxanthomonas sp. PXM03]|uniref:DUF2894 domain-containing protein n=1 Tax=Pseudoxanthomonas sp. PXM03 TaxID=2769284 RepID=UPI0017857217|nr:DUF2894 domain-containing protein [Pseudoxanthomonas sp. PXM03]MBD9436095.1 DUF2894 domain-containing protein [Pseudoxanthomonas sp. PXM03]